MKYIITTEDGKMIACYGDYESAELDAKDLSASEGQQDTKYCIYELTNSTNLGETIVQKTYEVKLTLPLPPEKKPEEPSKEQAEDKPEETKPEESKPEDDKTAETKPK